MYTVAEEDLEQLVCATIIGETEIFPRVSFMTTTSGSDTGQCTTYCKWLHVCIVTVTNTPPFVTFAATTDVDFTSVSDEFVFTANLMTVCEIITIINDPIPEPQETFQVQLISTTITRAVIGGAASTTITITDTDRMFLSVCDIHTSTHLHTYLNKYQFDPY